MMRLIDFLQWLVLKEVWLIFFAKADFESLMVANLIFLRIVEAASKALCFC
jgi:hypothetical protein